MIYFKRALLKPPTNDPLTNFPLPTDLPSTYAPTHRPPSSTYVEIDSSRDLLCIEVRKCYKRV